MIPVKIIKALNIRKDAAVDATKLGVILPDAGIVNMDGVKEDGKPWKGVSRWYFKYNDKQEKQWYWGGGVQEVAADAISTFARTIPRQNTFPNTQPNADWLNFLGIADIWNITKGTNVNVAVLDSGINLNNTDLAGRLLSADPQLDYVKNFFNTQPTVQDFLGHGTISSSLISSANLSLVTGVAPEAKLAIAKITGNGVMQGYKLLADSLRWAASKNDIDIISLSIGVNQPDPATFPDFQQAFEEAIAQKKIIVAAIGNLGNTTLPLYPAQFTDCISVAACDKLGNPWSNNISWPQTTIYAPGVNITAPVVKKGGYPADAQGLYLSSGTSQANAITAGVVALILSILKRKGVAYDVTSIKNILINNASPLGSGTQGYVLNPLKIFANI